MALRFSKAFDTTSEYWLELEYVFDLWEAKQFDSGWKEVEYLKPGNVVPNKYALKPSKRSRSSSSRATGSNLSCHKAKSVGLTQALALLSPSVAF
jgi:hypothetical protein